MCSLTLRTFNWRCESLTLGPSMGSTVELQLDPPWSYSSFTRISQTKHKALKSHSKLLQDKYVILCNVTYDSLFFITMAVTNDWEK